MALNQRKPQDVIHHSDQGCRYASIRFGLCYKEANVRPSMGFVGDCYDNAMCESFFATLEYELLQKNKFKARGEAGLKFLNLLRVGIIHIDVIHRWTICLRSSTKETIQLRVKPNSQNPSAKSGQLHFKKLCTVS